MGGRGVGFESPLPHLIRNESPLRVFPGLMYDVAEGDEWRREVRSFGGRWSHGTSFCQKINLELA
jgi:hypothetical protein